jgi:DNA modification methylase
VFELHIPELIQADARRIPLADSSVQCIVTSPPYWGLRKYEGAQDRVWEQEPGCEHQWGKEKRIRQAPQRDHAKGGGFAKTRATEAARKGMAFEASQGCFCSTCGAWKGSYGLEPTVELYVQHTIEIIRECWRVLRDDGLLFLNVSLSELLSPLGRMDGLCVTALSGRSLIRCQRVSKIVSLTRMSLC